MGPTSPVVSVIISGRPSCHAVHALDSAIRQQTEFPVEILILGECQEESLQRHLNALDADTHQRVSILPNAAGSEHNAAMAEAVQNCTGQFIALLDCDDFWTETDKLQQQVDFLRQQPKYAVSFHRACAAREDGQLMETTFPDESGPRFRLVDLLQPHTIPSSTGMIRRESLPALPDWYRRVTIGDWPLLLLAARHGDAGLIDTTMTALRQRAGDSQADTDASIPTARTAEQNLVLRRLREMPDVGARRQIERQLAENHRLMGIEMDRLTRGDRADRHRRLCFLYARWSARLPLRTKISHAIRPYRSLHFTAVLFYETLKAPKRLAPLLAFVASTLWKEPSWIFRIGKSLFQHGVSGVQREWRILTYLFGIGRQQYARWIRQFDTLTDTERESIGKRIEVLQSRPQFTVIMRVVNNSERLVNAAIASVTSQLYPDWELCIAADESLKPQLRRHLEEVQAADSRVRCVDIAESADEAEAARAALGLATGDFVTFVDHQDELTEHALYIAAEEINRHPDVRVIYSDEDQLDSRGRRVEPYFKTDWNPDLMLTHDLIGHLAVFRRDLVDDVGGVQSGFGASGGYDLALRCLEQVSDDQIRHIPAILYHRRQMADSTAIRAGATNGHDDAGARAIRDHLTRQNVEATVEPVTVGSPGYFRIRYALDPAPRVSVIIPTRDRLDLLKTCVEGLLHDTDYPNLEILIVDNESCETATLEYFASLKQLDSVRIVEFKGKFNYSSINNFAVRHASGEVICLLNNDIEVIHDDWLREMVSHAVREEVGAVGAKLLYPDDSIQHAGVMIGYGGLAGHTFSMLPVETPVPYGRLNVVQNMSCVTAACLVIRKAVFEEIGGLDEEAFAVAYNDVDLSLRIVTNGYRIVWTPHALLYHHESASRGANMSREAKALDVREGENLKNRWSDRIARDPHLNPNISVDHVDYRPAFPPRTRRPWSDG